MIIIDYNAIAIATIIVQKLDIDEDLIRHMILNSIRMYNKKFRNEYGQMVIATDSSNWRRDVFPEYKFKRRDGREESELDWTEIFRIINLVFEEIGDNLPYKTIKIDGCEADDIIGALVERTQEFGQGEDVMIVSADKDFIQLQKYNNVRQFSPMAKKFVQDSNPRRYLFEHVLKGDGSDGVPNVLSPDNTFVDGIRQSPMTKKKIEYFFENADNLESVMDREVYRNYCRNKKMIDLSETPQHLKDAVIDRYDSQKIAHRSKILNYLIKKRLKLLIECVEEFT
jgi:hypothetical protein